MPSLKYYAPLEIAVSAPEFAEGSTIAAGSTLNFQGATVKGPEHEVSGTTAITTITLAAGRVCRARFTESRFIEAGSSLLIPGYTLGQSLDVKVGDILTFKGYVGGIVRIVGAQRADGTALVGNVGSSVTVATTVAIAANSTTGSHTIAANSCGKITIGANSGTKTLQLPIGSTNDIVERRIEIAAGCTAIFVVKDASDATIWTYTATGEATAHFRVGKSAAGWVEIGLNAAIV